MTPWWLRPTAESEDKKKEEPKQEAEAAPGPEPRKAQAEKEARDTRGSGETSGKTKGRRPAKDDRQGPADDGRGRSARSRRTDDSQEPADDSDARGRRSSSRKPEQKPAPKEQGTDREKDKGTEKKRERRSRDAKEGPSDKDKGAKKQEQPKPKKNGGQRGPTPHDITAEDIASINRELFDAPGAEIDSVPERTISVNDERKIAMFCDLENIALGVRDSDIKKFDINLVLERLLEKGKIIVKRAYCDWERYSEYKRAFHEAAIEMLDIPQKYYSGKNSADIKMVVDAMDLCYAKEHLDTFAILSGDSDFSPLVSKLKENDKYVIGIGVKNSSSALLVDNCDEFIYYEDVWRDRQAAPQLAGLNKKSAEAFGLMIDAIQALIRENKEVLWGSMIKQTMQRKRPSFNEGYYGYSSFSELLEDAERKNILRLKKDKRSGTYIVTGFAKR